MMNSLSSRPPLAQAYLDALGMEKVENLVRQRSVGAWFLDHFDNPLEANLPLFPPNIEARTKANICKDG